MITENKYTVLFVYCINLILLFSITGCDCSNSKSSPNKKQSRASTVQLELQVSDIAGSSNISFKIINKGSITADLGKYKLSIGKSIGKDKVGNMVGDLKLVYSGATSIIEGRCITDKISKRD